MTGFDHGNGARKKCNRCGGDGQVAGTGGYVPCPKCGGSGKMPMGGCAVMFLCIASGIGAGVLGVLGISLGI